MAKKKFIKGWLSRDGEDSYCENIFLWGSKPVRINEYGTTYWGCSPIYREFRVTYNKIIKTWSIYLFTQIYGKKNLPDYGQCFEVEIEL